jgi:hypothetical protein
MSFGVPAALTVRATALEGDHVRDGGSNEPASDAWWIALPAAAQAVQRRGFIFLRKQQVGSNPIH